MYFDFNIKIPPCQHKNLKICMSLFNIRIYNAPFCKSAPRKSAACFYENKKSADMPVFSV